MNIFPNSSNTVTHNNVDYKIIQPCGVGPSKQAFLACHKHSPLQTVFIFYPNDTTTKMLQQFHKDIELLNHTFSTCPEKSKLTPIFTCTTENVIITKYTPQTRYVYQFLYD